MILFAGLLALLSLVVVVMPAFGWHTVMLASGSMSPAYPAGSLLLVRDAPARDIRVGDVVTVARPHRLPITHRVVAIEPGGGVLPGRVVTLQGDANAEPDPQPYDIDAAGIVVAGIPWGGQALAVLRSPIVLGLLTTLVAGLVLWSWWPARPEEERR